MSPSLKLFKLCGDDDDDNSFSHPKFMPCISVEKYGTARQAADDNIIWHRKDVICILEY